MTYQDIITIADGYRPNGIPRPVKEQALWKLECDIADMVGVEHYPALKYDGSTIAAGTKVRFCWHLKEALVDLTDTAYDDPIHSPQKWVDARVEPEPVETDGTLRLPDRWADVYVWHVCAAIDAANKDTALWEFDAARAREALAEAEAWWRRGHRPQKSGNWRV